MDEIRDNLNKLANEYLKDDECRCKPIKHVDDRSDPGLIVGSRVYIPWKEEHDGIR
jgi:hypothetical protein